MMPTRRFNGCIRENNRENRAAAKVKLYLLIGYNTSIFLLISGVVLILNGFISFFVRFYNNAYYHLFWAGGIILCTGSIGAKSRISLAIRATLKQFFGFCVMSTLASIAGMGLAAVTIVYVRSHESDMALPFGMNIAVIVWYAVTVAAVVKAMYVYAQLSKYTEAELLSGQIRPAVARTAASSHQNQQQHTPPPTYEQIVNGAVSFEAENNKNQNDNLPNQPYDVLPPSYASIPKSAHPQDVNENNIANTGDNA